MNKNKLFLLVALICTTTVLFSADDLSVDSTARDLIGTTYNWTPGQEDGTFLLLGLRSPNNINLTTNASGSVTVVTVDGNIPGGQLLKNTTSAGQTDVGEALGGHLQYTVHGQQSNVKIVVEKSSFYSTEQTYIPDTLEVRIANLTAGGSSIATIGTGIQTYVKIGNTQQDLITGISGNDTWTGTGATDGAQLQYRLVGDPGIPEVDILYTILADPII